MNVCTGRLYVRFEFIVIGLLRHLYVMPYLLCHDGLIYTVYLLFIDGMAVIILTHDLGNHLWIWSIKNWLTGFIILEVETSDSVFPHSGSKTAISIITCKWNELSGKLNPPSSFGYMVTGARP